jgi:hypothetical protein
MSGSDGGDAFPTCPIGTAPDFGVKGLNVDGVACYPGGPPTGACGPEVACEYCAVPILCTPTYGPRTSYACVCSGGSWSCTVDWQDTAVCASDAGAADAAADGALDATTDAAVTTDGAVCAPGQIACPVGCSSETECSSARACIVPPCLPPQP